MNGQSAGASCPPFVSDPLIPIVVNELCPVVISMSSPWKDPVPPYKQEEIAEGERLERRC